MEDAPAAVFDSSLRGGRVEEFQHQREPGDSEISDMDIVDRLVSLWTTVKSS